MSALEDYADYFTEDDAYPDDVIFNIPVRVKKALVVGGVLDIFAAFHGWNPSDDTNAPDKCIEVIKKFVNERGVAAYAAAKTAQAEAEVAYVKNNLF